MILVENNQQRIMMDKKRTLKKQKSSVLVVPILAILMACFYPTSVNGVILNTKSLVWYYLVSSVIITIVFFINKRDMKLIYISVALIIYLEIVTLLCTTVTGASFSIARFAPVFICLVVFTVQVKETGSFRVLKALFEIITIIMVVWNVGIIFQIKPIMDLTVNNYSQFNYYTVSYGVSIGKPIFTFGAHTFASFFYMLVFYLWYVTIKNDVKYRLRYYFYLIALMVLTVLLKSSSSLVFSIVMFTLIINMSKNIVVKIGAALFVITIVSLLFNTELYYIYSTMVTSSYNGIIPRYLSENNVFIGNFSVLKEVILGIGYTIPRDYTITYTDSGYIVYFTMGNILLPIVLYYMLRRFFRNNIGNYTNGLFIFVLMFELAIPSLIYLKTTFFLIFIIYYLKSLNRNVKTRNVQSK